MIHTRPLVATSFLCAFPYQVFGACVQSKSLQPSVALPKCMGGMNVQVLSSLKAHLVVGGAWQGVHRMYRCAGSAGRDTTLRHLFKPRQAVTDTPVSIEDALGYTFRDKHVMHTAVTHSCGSLFCFDQLQTHPRNDFMLNVDVRCNVFVPCSRCLYCSYFVHLFLSLELYQCA